MQQYHSRISILLRKGKFKSMRRQGNKILLRSVGWQYLYTQVYLSICRGYSNGQPQVDEGGWLGLIAGKGIVEGSTSPHFAYRIHIYPPILRTICTIYPVIMRTMYTLYVCIPL